MVLTGPAGFALFDWIDDTSWNALLCSSNALSQAAVLMMSGEPTKATELVHYGQSSMDAAHLIYTVSENAGALYDRYRRSEVPSRSAWSSGSRVVVSVQYLSSISIATLVPRNPCPPRKFQNSNSAARNKSAIHPRVFPSAQRYPLRSHWSPRASAKRTHRRGRRHPSLAPVDCQCSDVHWPVGLRTARRANS